MRIDGALSGIDRVRRDEIRWGGGAGWRGVWGSGQDRMGRDGRWVWIGIEKKRNGNAENVTAGRENCGVERSGGKLTQLGNLVWQPFNEVS